jgi:hypothetical protein
MSVTAAALRELHRIHRQLSDLRERLDRGPKQVQARKDNVTRLESELAHAKDDAKSAKVHADQKQLLLRSGEAKIQDLKSKLNAASSNREYQALKDQIAADEMANSVLADEILESLEKIDELVAAVRQAEQNLSTARDDLARLEVQTRDQQGLLDQDLRRLEAQLRDAEKMLPVDFREAYDRNVRSKGSDAMAQVDGESCSGCNQRITPNMFNSLRMSRVVCCQSCGRLLYLPEERGASGAAKE